jgi:hypothetical protein
MSMIASDLEICGKSIPSKTVGGDLVDAVCFDGTVTCSLADVSGHGIAAAVLMSMAKSAQERAYRGMSPGRPDAAAGRISLWFVLLASATSAS